MGQFLLINNLRIYYEKNYTEWLRTRRSEYFFYSTCRMTRKYCKTCENSSTFARAFTGWRRWYDCIRSISCSVSFWNEFHSKYFFYSNYPCCRACEEKNKKEVLDETILDGSNRAIIFSGENNEKYFISWSIRICISFRIYS
jgi:hypothetical protein